MLRDYRVVLNDLIFAWPALSLEVFHLVHHLRAMPDETPMTEAQARYIERLWRQYRGDVVHWQWEETNG